MLLGMDSGKDGELSSEMGQIVDKDTAGVLEECRAHADRLISEHIVFVVEPETPFRLG